MTGRVRAIGLGLVPWLPMNLPSDMHYTREHEWVGAADEAGVVRVGITDYAQDALGDVVFVDLPAVGSTVTATEMFGELESTKSVSELYAPVSGTVAAINEALTDTPGLINDDPYGDGWLVEIRLSDPAAVEGALADLLDAEAYRQLTEG